MKRYLLILFIFPFLFGIMNAQDNIKDSSNCRNLEGTLRDKNTDETIPFAKVALYQLGRLIKGQDTNQGGDYDFIDIPYGKYEVKASIYGYDFVLITEVEIKSCQRQFVELDFEQENSLYAPIMIINYVQPKIQSDHCGQGPGIPFISVQKYKYKDKTDESKVEERNLPGPAEKDPDKAPIEYSLYPNPSFGLINVESNFEVLEMRLYDMIGHNLGSVQYQILEEGKISMDLSSLPASTYILQMRHEGGSQTEKVIILEQ